MAEETKAAETPTAVQAVKQETGTFLIDGKEYISKESYDVIATKNREYKTAAEKLQAEQDEAKQKTLAEQGKWEEVAKKAQEDLAAVRNQAQAEKKQAEFTKLASEAGAHNPATLAKLVNIDEGIKVAEDGTFDSSALKTALEGLKKTDAFLFGEKKAPDAGNPGGGSPAGGTGPRTFKVSELSDSTFYQANRAEILKAQEAGLIVDDVNPTK